MARMLALRLVLQLVLVVSGVTMLRYFVRQIRADRVTPPLIAAELAGGVGFLVALLLVSRIGS